MAAEHEDGKPQETLQDLMRNFETATVRYGKAQIRFQRAYANELYADVVGSPTHISDPGWKSLDGSYRELERTTKHLANTRLTFTFTLRGNGFPVSGFNFARVELVHKTEAGVVRYLLATLAVGDTDIGTAPSQAKLLDRLLRLHGRSSATPVAKALVDLVQHGRAPAETQRA